MATKRITNKAVEAAKVAAADYVLWDDTLKGFGLKVAKGGRKIFIAQFRLGGRSATTVRVTIGVNGSPWDAATARKEASRVLHLASTGVDPRIRAREIVREAIELRFDEYVKSFLKLYAKQEWRDRTYKTHDSNFRRWIVPALRSQPLPSIHRRDVTRVMDALPIGSPALPRNIFALMRRLFSWAVERGDIEKSPMEGMRVPKAPTARQRVLTDRELLIVAASSDDLGTIWGTFARLLLLTGQRRGEVANMRWEELSREAKLWTIPGSRTKNKLEHRFPLNSLCIAELDGIAGGNEWPEVGLVLTHGEEKSISNFSKVKVRLDELVTENLGEALPPWSFHDFRRTFATTMQRLGIRFEVIEALSNRVSSPSSSVAAVYQRHDWADEKRQAVEAHAQHLLKLVNASD